jgi:hypothetical protein
VGHGYRRIAVTPFRASENTKCRSHSLVCSAINDVSNPNQKLGCILNSCRVIIYQLQSGGSAASADDFLPHLIWTVLQAAPARLHANVEYIRRYASPDALRMEVFFFFLSFHHLIY